MLPPNPKQHYLVLIRLQRKISFVTSFTISKWLKIMIFSGQDASVPILKQTTEINNMPLFINQFKDTKIY